MVKTVNLRTISYHYEHHHEIKEQEEDELNEGHKQKIYNLGIHLHFLGQKPSTSTGQSGIVG